MKWFICRNVCLCCRILHADTSKPYLHVSFVAHAYLLCTYKRFKSNVENDQFQMLEFYIVFYNNISII